MKHAFSGFQHRQNMVAVLRGLAVLDRLRQGLRPVREVHREEAAFRVHEARESPPSPGARENHPSMTIYRVQITLR